MILLDIRTVFFCRVSRGFVIAGRGQLAAGSDIPLTGSISYPRHTPGVLGEDQRR